MKRPILSSSCAPGRDAGFRSAETATSQEGLYKLKVEHIRIIRQPDVGKTGPVLKALFAERRKVVYEMFSQIFGLE
jgi:hypothetical protein